MSENRTANQSAKPVPIQKTMRSPLQSVLRGTSILVIAATTLAPSTLHASTITYNLVLIPQAGSLYGGTGTITLNAAPSASGISDYTASKGTLDNLTFTLDNQTFTLAGATGNTLVRFLNGQLNDITFAETIGKSPNRFTLDTTANYAFYYNNGQAASYGSFLASPAAFTQTTSAVSEPTSLALFGTGLLLSIGLLYRTRSPRFTSKTHLPEA
jgi:hypothetical protein